MPRAPAIAYVDPSGLAIEIAITPPVLVKVPRAVISPPVIVPAAMPLPEIIPIPLAPELVMPARLTLATESTITPPVAPELVIKAKVAIFPPVPVAVKLIPAAELMVADATVYIP